MQTEEDGTEREGGDVLLFLSSVDVDCERCNDEEALLLILVVVLWLLLVSEGELITPV
jgi:hypothetical protein